MMLLASKTVFRKNKKFFYIIFLILITILLVMVMWISRDHAMKKALANHFFEHVEVTITRDTTYAASDSVLSETYMIRKDGNDVYIDDGISEWHYDENAEEQYHFFDFSVFEKLKEYDYKYIKEEDCYIPAGNANNIFMVFHDIAKHSKTNYQDIRMQFFIRDDKLGNIKLSYLYQDEIFVSYNYHFKYQNGK